MSNDLETLLRDTLSARADTVPNGPVWEPDRVPAPRHRRWPAPLVAAAVMLAVAGAVVAVQHSSDRQQPAHPSGTPAPSPSHSASPSPTGSAPAPVAVCATSLPKAWRSAVSDGTTRAGGASAFPLAVAPDGRVLITRDFGSARDVALLSVDGSARRIYSVPSPNENQVLDGAVEGRWALLDVSRLPRHGNGVTQTVVAVVLVDLDTGDASVVASTTQRDLTEGRRTIDGAVIFEGRIYYDVRPRYAARTGAIHAYDVADRSDQVVATGPVLPPRLVGAGVTWRQRGLQIARPLPGAVAQATGTVPRAAAHLSTDGASYAWVPKAHELAWWGPSVTTPRIFTMPHGQSAEIEAVAGPLVMYEPDTPEASTHAAHVLDTRTGAATVLPGLQPYAVAGNGVLANYVFTGPAKGSPVAAVRLDTTKLPELHC